MIFLFYFKSIQSSDNSTRISENLSLNAVLNGIMPTGPRKALIPPKSFCDAPIALERRRQLHRRPAMLTASAAFPFLHDIDSRPISEFRATLNAVGTYPWSRG